MFFVKNINFSFFSFLEKNYWAKDIIFLVTEQEQLGMHAFLEAYFNTEIEENAKRHTFLDYGNLPARAGSLQAALNIEVQDLDIGKKFLGKFTKM